MAAVYPNAYVSSESSSGSESKTEDNIEDFPWDYSRTRNDGGLSNREDKSDEEPEVDQAVHETAVEVWKLMLNLIQVAAVCNEDSTDRPGLISAIGELAVQTTILNSASTEFIESDSRPKQVPLNVTDLPGSNGHKQADYNYTAESILKEQAKMITKRMRALEDRQAATELEESKQKDRATNILNAEKKLLEDAKKMQRKWPTLNLRCYNASLLEVTRQPGKRSPSGAIESLESISTPGSDHPSDPRSLEADLQTWARQLTALQTALHAREIKVRNGERAFKERSDRHVKKMDARKAALEEAERGLEQDRVRHVAAVRQRVAVIEDREACLERSEYDFLRKLVDLVQKQVAWEDRMMAAQEAGGRDALMG